MSTVEAGTAQPTSPAPDDRVPTEFLSYHDALRRRRVRLARTVARRVLRTDIVPSEDRVRGLAAGYYDADPAADAFIEEVYLGRSSREGRRMLDLAIERGVEAVPDAPASLVRLFDEIDTDPGWLDRDQVRLGARVFRRYGVAALFNGGAGEFLGFTENSASKPMSLTGAFTGATALRRFMETARFWIDTTDPGGMDRGAAGYGTAIRVRIMHAYLRRRLVHHPEWDEGAWGVPISQTELIGPQLGVALPVVFGMRAIGHRTSRAEHRAVMHFWRYVGHVMGVDPRWYPTTVREGLQYFTLMGLKRTYSGGAEAAEIIESYPRAFRPRPGTPPRKRLRDEVNHRIQLGYTGFFLPPGFYRRYDMPRKWPWVLHPPLQIPFNLAMSTITRHSEGAARAIDRYQRWRRETWWRNEMGDDRATFAVAERFRR